MADSDDSLIALQSFGIFQYPLVDGGHAMASITVRNLEDSVKARLRMRAAERGRSMEEEVRVILRDAVRSRTEPENLAQAIRARFAPLGGVELQLPPRDPMREPPDFG